MSPVQLFCQRIVYHTYYYNKSTFAVLCFHREIIYHICMYLELAFVLSVILVMIVILTFLYGRTLYRPALICMCIGYLAGLIYYTFLWGNRAGISSFDYSVNHVLIDSILNLDYNGGTHTAFMNLCLFVPFGYLLPQISGFKWWQVILCGAGATLVIELLQPSLQRGAFQVDDLVKNSIGAVVGLLLYEVSVGVRKRREMRGAL